MQDKLHYWSKYQPLKVWPRFWFPYCILTKSKKVVYSSHSSYFWLNSSQLLQDDFKITSRWLQDDFKMKQDNFKQDETRWIQDDFRMTSGWLQDDFRMTSGWLQDDFRMTSGWQVFLSVLEYLTWAHNIHSSLSGSQVSLRSFSGLSVLTSSDRWSLKYFVLFL